MSDGGKGVRGEVCIGNGMRAWTVNRKNRGGSASLPYNCTRQL